MTTRFIEPPSTPSALLLLGRGTDLSSERGVECPGDLPAASDPDLIALSLTVLRADVEATRRYRPERATVWMSASASFQRSPPGTGVPVCGHCDGSSPSMSKLM